MSYAIIKTGGKQFAVENGQTLRVPTINAEVGNSVDIDTLFTGGALGASTLKATVVSHGKDDKIIVFKKKRRKQYKRRQGHRQGFTEIRID
jgi:large subunit ribosomal protein L21